MLTITCDHCRTRLQLKEAYAGRRIRCLVCEGVLTVPSVGVAVRPPVASGPRRVADRTPPPPTRRGAPSFAAPARPADRKRPWKAVGLAALVLLLLLGLIGCFLQLFRQASPPIKVTPVAVVPDTPTPPVEVKPIPVVKREKIDPDATPAQPAADPKATPFLTRLKLLERTTGPVELLTYSPDSRRALFVTGQTTLHLWDVVEVKELWVRTGHTRRITRLVFSPDGTEVLSGGEDETVLLWNVDSGQELHRASHLKGSLAKARFSPDGKRVLTGYETDPQAPTELHLWDVTTWEEVVVTEEWRVEWVQDEMHSIPGPVTAPVDLPGVVATTRTVLVPEPPTVVQGPPIHVPGPPTVVQGPPTITQGPPIEVPGPPVYVPDTGGGGTEIIIIDDGGCGP